MKVTLIPSSMTPDGVDQSSYLISYLINDSVAIDAGGIGFYGTPFDQARIKHVFISHTHADHVASLPIFVENAYEGKDDCVTIHGSDVVLDSLQRDLFNDRIWPDFIALSKVMPPFLKLSQIEAGTSVKVEGLTITPIGVDHVVPTLGFVIDDGTTCVIVASDTGPTEEIWKVARVTPHLKSVFLEAAFPDGMHGLAKISKHLTPASFAMEVAKLGRPEVEVVAIHVKARYRPEVLGELKALGLSNVVIGQLNHTYEY